MRDSAALACRSPPRLRRRRCVLPEDASTGLTPQRAAKPARCPAARGVAGSDNQGDGDVWTDAVALKQLWGVGGHRRGDLALRSSIFWVRHRIRCASSRRVPAPALVASVGAAGSSCAHRRMRTRLVSPDSDSRSAGSAATSTAFSWLIAWVRDLLLDSIPRPDDVPAKEDKRFRATAAELLDRILQLADNAGATNEHRALNYLAVRYPAIYAQTAAAHSGNASLTAVDVRPSRLRGVRMVVDVIFSYTHRQTDVTEKYFVRVDVTEEFPFLVTKLSPYYDR
jgi:hypothetical protein